MDTEVSPDSNKIVEDVEVVGKGVNVAFEGQTDSDCFEVVIHGKYF